MEKHQKEQTYKRYKTPHEEGFTTIPNKLILDNRLSDSAFRILIYLLHNSPDWKVYQHKMMEDLGQGRDRCKEGIVLLEELGYLKRHQVRESGRFSHYHYEFHHTPIFANSSQLPVHSVHKSKKKGSPATEKPAPVNPHLPMTKLTSNLKIRKDNGTAVKPPLTMQSNQKTKSNRKTMDIGKRYALNESQLQALSFLCSERLNTDEPTLSFYAKSFSLERINAALIELRSSKPRNPGAYFRKLLFKDLDEKQLNTLNNAVFAEEFKLMNHVDHMLITKTHVIIGSLKIPLNAIPEQFIDLLGRIEL